jgi:hypothetical protein
MCGELAEHQQRSEIFVCPGRRAPSHALSIPEDLFNFFLICSLIYHCLATDETHTKLLCVDTNSGTANP